MRCDDAGWHQRRIARLLTEPRGTGRGSSAPDSQDDRPGVSTESPDINRFLAHLQSKRLKMVAHAYPATVRAASAAYGQARLAEMFWAGQPPRHMRPSTAYIQNIDMWSTFIQERAFATRLPWITDLAKFERFRCKLILRVEEEPERAGEPGSGEVLLTERYQISPRCDVASFQHDVVAIATHFLRGGTLLELPSDLSAPKDVHLLIQCSPTLGSPALGDPVPRTYQVGAKAARLIQGFATGKTIAEVLDENPGCTQPEDRNRDIRAISQMAARGIICPAPVSS